MFQVSVRELSEFWKKLIPKSEGLIILSFVIGRDIKIN